MCDCALVASDLAGVGAGLAHSLPGFFLPIFDPWRGKPSVGCIFVGGWRRRRAGPGMPAAIWCECGITAWG